MLDKKKLEYYQDLISAGIDRLYLDSLNVRSLLFFASPLLTLVVLFVGSLSGSVFRFWGSHSW
jgi:hypothetical protein